MLRHGWSGVVAAVFMMALSARVGFAQDAKDEELRDLKRRLEILEKDKQTKEAVTPGSALVADPVEEKWYDKVHVGGGVRTTFRAQEVPLPGGDSAKSRDFTLESGRLYTGGKINDFLSATLNAEFTSGSAAVLDAICQMKVSDGLNIFFGRALPATDRSNSDGPYYLSTWDFPFLSDGFNATGKLGDREDGVTVWGDVGNFKYWVGAYEGFDHGTPTANFGDALLYAARVQFNFLDPEPGYYLTSTYYGEKSILAIGLAANYQANAAGGAIEHANYGNIVLDFLFEKKLDFLLDGTLTVESAFYYYGRSGFGAAEGGVSTIDVGAGTGFLFSVAYLIPGQVGWGRFQPHIRYQGFDESATNAVKNPTADNTARWDIGVNYVMVGHNARISLVYSHTAVTGNEEFGMWTLGSQFQF